ncbi:MAG TPA: UDP-N-acetylglucosamine 2-epimerase (non-hydrolyzing) [Gaiellaceae bacterium]|jgi:UDP-N-acetylglucosamine 2-epimerase (non-hydrolysing)
MSRPLVVHVVGARPNYMKVAPVYAELERRGRVEQRLVHTGQHYDALLKDVFFAELPLPRPHVELEIGSGSHGEQTGRALIELERIFVDMQPDLVVVAGDVNSTLAGALAAVKIGVPVCHVESGLRSFDWRMPEEHNRRIADHLSTLLLTHCEDANENLAAEGIAEEQIGFVGNTMIDTLLANLDAVRALAASEEFGVEPGRYALVTLHRPSLVDIPDLLARTIGALDEVAHSLPVIFPVHPRTQRTIDSEGLAERTRIVLTPPLSYRHFLSLEADAGAVITDSGGIQEETTALGVPCFTLRENTERPVTVTLGTNTILGLEPEALLDIPSLLSARRPAQVPPLWDGRAGERAAAEVERLLSLAEVPA